MSLKPLSIKTATAVYPVKIIEKFEKKLERSIINTYTEGIQEHGEIVWYLYLVDENHQISKYKLDFFEPI